MPWDVVRFKKKSQEVGVPRSSEWDINRNEDNHRKLFGKLNIKNTESDNSFIIS